MRSPAIMLSEVPTRRTMTVTRRDWNNTSMQGSQKEKSKAWERTSSAGSAAQHSILFPESRRKNRKDFLPIRGSTIYDDRPVSTIRNASSFYSAPPFHPKEADEFWSRMREDDELLCELHQKVCASKGIPFHPKKRSGSSASQGVANSCRVSDKSPMFTSRSRRGCRSLLSAQRVKVKSQKLLKNTPPSAKNAGILRSPSRPKAVITTVSPIDDKGEKKKDVPTLSPAQLRQRPIISAGTEKGSPANKVGSPAEYRSASGSHRTAQEGGILRGSPSRLKSEAPVGNSSPESPSESRLNGKGKSVSPLREATANGTPNSSPKKVCFKDLDFPTN